MSFPIAFYIINHKTLLALNSIMWRVKKINIFFVGRKCAQYCDNYDEVLLLFCGKLKLLSQTDLCANVDGSVSRIENFLRNKMGKKGTTCYLSFYNHSISVLDFWELNSSLIFLKNNISFSPFFLHILCKFSALRPYINRLLCISKYKLRH